MNITVNPQHRTAEFNSPSVFSLEAANITMTGIAAADLSTLKLALFSIGTPETPDTLEVTSVLLALCESFTPSGSNVTCVLDTRTTNALELFVGKRPDQRIPVDAVLADNTKLWFSHTVDLINNPFCIPVGPAPSVIYLTSSMFDGISPLSTNTTPDEVAALLSAILTRLQQP